MSLKQHPILTKPSLIGLSSCSQKMRLMGAKLANIDNLDRLTGGPIFLHVVVFDAYDYTTLDKLLGKDGAEGYIVYDALSNARTLAARAINNN